MIAPRLAVALAGVTVALLSGCARTAADSAGAFRAFIAHDLRQAERLYRAVAETDTAPARDRADALRRLAALAWRYRLDADSGRALLRRALGVGVDSSTTYAELARLETAAGRAAAAHDAAAAALRGARSQEEHLTGLTRLAEAAVGPALAAALTEGRRPDSAAQARVRAALERLEPVNRATPGVLDPSWLQLHAALLLDDGEAALSAWRSYYLLHLARGGPLPAADDTLARVLPRWDGPRASAGDRRAVVLALAASGCYEAALLVATDPRVDPEATADGPVADVIAYARFVRRSRSRIDEYYRATALGDGDPDALREGLRAEASALWERLRWPEAPPPFDEPAFVEEARRRFGAEINLGRTAGYFDVHWGHRVVNEPRVVEQYGHRADLRYLALDGMVSNGFQSWAWDGTQRHGGWATDSSIVQVRPGYASSPLRAWRALTDSVEQERRRNQDAADSVADLERARRDPYAFLPGLANRLFGEDPVTLRDSLAQAGLSGDALRAAFLAIYERARVESSIFAHEGRHAIDRRLGLDLELWEREYRAKLSEVAFAPRPRLALRGAILSANIGDATPHGRANRKIMEELVGWMRAHAAEIEGFDAAMPVLPQLSLLSDPQLRQAFRSFDPMAR